MNNTKRYIIQSFIDNPEDNAKWLFDQEISEYEFLSGLEIEYGDGEKENDYKNCAIKISKLKDFVLYVLKKSKLITNSSFVTIRDFIDIYIKFENKLDALFQDILEKNYGKLNERISIINYILSVLKNEDYKELIVVGEFISIVEKYLENYVEYYCKYLTSTYNTLLYEEKIIYTKKIKVSCIMVNMRN